MKITKKYMLYDRNGNATEHELPARWHICGNCDGAGCSSGYLGAFTGEEMHEDPEFFEAYMNGAYDRMCETCKGTGKVLEIDWKRVPRGLARKIRGDMREELEYRRMIEAEIKAGA